MKYSMLNINRFNINKMFGWKDVNLTFDGNVKIYVGENGIGKTTILNIIYFTLTLDFEKLREIDFESIEIEFKNKENAIIKREWLLIENDSFDFDRYRLRLNRHLTPDEFEFVFNKIYRAREKTLDDFINLFNDGLITRRANVNGIFSDIKRLEIHADARYSDYVNNVRKAISKNITQRILYFPTYRRIEEDLNKLGYKIQKEEEKSAYLSQNSNKASNIVLNTGEIIQFGMNDVYALIEKLEKKIQDSTLSGYSQITGKMINHLVHDNKVDIEMKEVVKNAESLNIVLERVGTHLDKNDKIRIRDLVASNVLFESNQNNYNPLIYFLYNLIQLYEEHSEIDNSIKLFRKACNNFLVDKEIVYNESLVKVNVMNKYGNKIELSNLSSGEKQIVSLFSKIYLDINNEFEFNTSNDFVILFDEPELSLSIEWQEKLLPEIMSSGKCSFMLAVTHSPFIYANNLRDCAESIQDCMKETEQRNGQ
ncbi:AAA family ATPase [Paenibacillus sp. GSMTC-2017]|uniref:AAA family ATPase n=1 Tax=Paenibacillus sp. GSMTC-2017 TaxID=2794350 RepID=UPI0018D67DED|nr:AAA family ATPase [Paenibacillus sp. GSMTC-2017]MBH5319030.1 AAA family ATPase [Paenibacillus sp. GSMTC-2017]